MLRKLFCCINKDDEDHTVEEPIPYGEDEIFIEVKKCIQSRVRYRIIDYNKNYHSNEECSICFDEFNKDNTEIALLPCLHYFHKECIDSWWETSNKYECPICRMQT
jgi:hypothetical protein